MVSRPDAVAFARDATSLLLHALDPALDLAKTIGNLTGTGKQVNTISGPDRDRAGLSGLDTGASGLAVGLIAGFGELVGYALRLGSGYLADKTGRYWGITILGYVLNLLSVPLLALTGRWEFAAGLMITERVGKAIRTPARDAMLSHGTKEIGHGWGFGFHAAMDQTGAVIGPLLVAGIVASGFGYHRAFGILLGPALAAIAVLIAAAPASTRARATWRRLTTLPIPSTPRPRFDSTSSVPASSRRGTPISR